MPRSATEAPANAAQREGQALEVSGGDRVVLSCGEVYPPLRLRLKAPTTVPVRVGPEAACPADKAPVFDGRESLVWQPDSSAGASRWAAQTASVVTQVFVGDVPLARARFPADRYLVLGAGHPPSDQQLPALPQLIGRDLAGARLHARTREWLIEELDIASARGDLAPALRYPLQPRAGFYLTGKLWMLTGEPAWTQDRARHRLWVVADQAQGLGVVVDQPLLSVEGQGSLELDGVNFFAAGSDAVRAQLTGEVAIRHVQILWSAGNGISVQGARRVSVLDSLIRATGRDALFVSAVDQLDFRRNDVQEAGMVHAPGQSVGAINAHGAKRAVIEENRISRSAYIGIRFAGRASVRGNLLTDSCLVLSDCGAIYSWRRDHLDRRGPSIVSGNAIAGVGEGTDTSVKLGVNDWFAGVYLDEWTREVRVSRNLVVGANQGVYLHNAFENQVDGNLVLGSRVAAVLDLVDRSLRPELATRPPEPPNQIDGNLVRAVGGGWSLVDRAQPPGKSTHLAVIGLAADGLKQAVRAAGPRCLPSGPSDPLPQDEPMAFLWLACQP